jgi:predicted nuclease with TOPRIM domain
MNYTETEYMELFNAAEEKNAELEIKLKEKMLLLEAAAKRCAVYKNKATKYEILYNESKGTIERLSKRNTILEESHTKLRELSKQVKSFINVTGWL